MENLNILFFKDLKTPLYAKKENRAEETHAVDKATFRFVTCA